MFVQIGTAPYAGQKHPTFKSACKEIFGICASKVTLLFAKQQCAQNTLKKPSDIEELVHRFQCLWLKEPSDIPFYEQYANLILHARNEWPAITDKSTIVNELNYQWKLFDPDSKACVKRMLSEETTPLPKPIAEILK